MKKIKVNLLVVTHKIGNLTLLHINHNIIVIYLNIYSSQLSFFYFSVSR